MNYVKFTHPDGSTHVWVNLEAVHAVNPSGEGKVTVHTPTFTVEVDRGQFEKAVSRESLELPAIGSLVTRLIQALDRLSVRIPTSIRLHL